MTRITIPFFISILIFSTTIGYGYNYNDYSWVQRSGAIMILIAIWMTFKTFSEWNHLDVYGEDKTSFWSLDSLFDPLGSHLQTQKLKKYKIRNEKAKELVLKNVNNILKIEKIMLLMGTFIWGFGDLISELPQNKSIIIGNMFLLLFGLYFTVKIDNKLKDTNL